MICDTVRSKVCEKMSNCKGLALMKTYLDALVRLAITFHPYGRKVTKQNTKINTNRVGTSLILQMYLVYSMRILIETNCL
jgi:hypothetical protein